MVVVFTIGIAEVNERDILTATKPAFEDFVVDDEGGEPIVVGYRVRME